MRFAKMMSIVLVLAVVSVFPNCSIAGLDGYSMAVLGTADGDAAITFGKRVTDNAEVGLTGVFFRADDNHYTPAVGPYAAYLIPVPGEIADDWQPFTGAAMLMETEDFGFIPKAFAGVIYKPHDTLSPYLMVEKAWPSGNISTPDIMNREDDVYTWFGLRLRF